MRSGRVLSRREFLALTAAASAWTVAGCATNPVTGGRQLMLVSEAEEIRLDGEWAPHQFSADYGASQDGGLNEYVAEVGGSMVELTHRPHMPYSFRAVNNVIANAYTFPGGSIAVTRGLLLAMDNEAELASVLGHELGHVSARHAGERMTKSLLAMAVVAGMGAYVEKEREEYAALAAGLGGVGANLLLCRYSRDDEREADALGMEYMTRAGYNPQGMGALMAVLRDMHKHKASAVEVLFATHPLSEERYETAVERARDQYAYASEYPEERERYLDRTATLRALSGVVEKLQSGQKEMTRRRFGEAESYFLAALKEAPDDYTAHLLIAKCYLAMGKQDKARPFIDRAKGLYPGEPQAFHLSGVAHITAKSFGAALDDFTTYEDVLPGNANTVFFKGYCLDRMGRGERAAEEYVRYRNIAPAGEYSAIVGQRLVEMGVLRPVKEGT